MTAIRFDILARASDCPARLGRLITPHGEVQTPAFMPVGTRGAIRGLPPQLVAGVGTQIVLANTYHLLLRPGPDLIRRLGGLHTWMNWPRPILTDSGGYQVFSLAEISRVDDEGVLFKSHLDGQSILLTPESAIQTQNALGADIIMALDDCPPAVSAPEQTSPQQAVRVQQATHRTIRWLERCIQAHQRPQDQALFGIVQGGTDLDLRRWCLQAVCRFDLPGYAIGGVAVGEDYPSMKRVVEYTAPLLPEDRPRYLMGVGYERDILMAVRAGVDLFDCVLPTRNGRHAIAFTSQGRLRLRNACYADDPRPIEETCDCPACSDQWWGKTAFFQSLNPAAGGREPPKNKFFSRSYLRHLFAVGDMLGPLLVSLHNLRHFQRLMVDIRRAISENDWSIVRRNWPEAWTALEQPESPSNRS